MRSPIGAGRRWPRDRAARRLPALRRAGAAAVPAARNGAGASEPAGSRTRRTARAVPRGTLAMAACAACGFVFNRAFDPALLRYGAGLRQHAGALATLRRASGRARPASGGAARRARRARSSRSAAATAISCAGWSPGRAPATPASASTRPIAARRRRLGGRLRFVRRPVLWRPAADSRRAADVVICRHVIEHLADPRRCWPRSARPSARILRDALRRLDPAPRRAVGFLLRALFAVLAGHPRASPSRGPASR